jgi:hypothetical protein
VSYLWLQDTLGITVAHTHQESQGDVSGFTVSVPSSSPLAVSRGRGREGGHYDMEIRVVSILTDMWITYIPIEAFYNIFEIAPILRCFVFLKLT